MDQFIQAANYTPSNRTRDDIWWFCIHDEETPQKPHIAHEIATMFHNEQRGPNGASAHRVVDANEIIGCVRWHDIAWAAPGANTHGMHWEQSGFAKDTKNKWKSDYGLAMMEVLAHDMSREMHQSGLRTHDARLLTVDEIRKNHPGIVTHALITEAFKTPGGHTDPGPNYPIHHVIDRIKFYLDKMR